MLSRSREITFRDGSTIETPLLVPSLSSKGFSPISLGEGGDGALPAPAAITEVLTPSAFEEALLISAFDVQYGQVREPDSLKTGFLKSGYAIPRFLIIDSGWYEATTGSDLGEPYQERRKAFGWSEQDFINLVTSFDPTVKAALVSFDRHIPYIQQIDAAQEFFTNHPHFVRTLMLKPQSRDSFYHHFAELVPQAGRLHAFDIIGVAEKELGNTILGRLKAIADLKKLLEDASVNAPIHVFGGLDPLFTPLYFAAGAEIFDGLSWLRYAYHEGTAIYQDSLPLINRQFEKRLPAARFRVQANNLDAIRELSRDLKIFHGRSEDWTVLNKGEILKPAHDALLSAVRNKHGR